MFLESRIVSRKTAGDGGLEITRYSAQQIERLGAVTIALDGEPVDAALSTMACTCRGADNPHVHYFLKSERFKQLQPGTQVSLDLDAHAGKLSLTSEPETA